MVREALDYESKQPRPPLHDAGFTEQSALARLPSYQASSGGFSKRLVLLWFAHSSQFVYGHCGFSFFKTVSGPMLFFQIGLAARKEYRQL